MTDPTDAGAAGRALVLEAGPCRAVIHPDDGGRLGQLDLGDGPLLRGPAPGLAWTGWGSYPLVPWANRLPGGRLRYGDIDERLPINFADGSAIHGLGAAVPWTVSHRSERRVDLEVELVGGPYRVRSRQRFELSATGLRQELDVTNEGPEPVPVGLGIHPWFRYGPVRVPADRIWPGEPLPTGTPVPVSGDRDLRSPTEVAPMDACFTDLTDSSADVGDLRLSWGGPITNVVVFSGEPGWVCVEPVTMANDGIAMAERGVEGHGVQVLDPGSTLTVDYSFERRPR
ncbi:MAG: hypothetical protein GX643_06760 [Acidimicrobiales bacterium]|nr:hypothetical protein [Acidimicrobiales bacterium]